MDAKDGRNKVRYGRNSDPAVRFPFHTMGGEPLMASELEKTAAALEATREVIRISKIELSRMNERASRWEKSGCKNTQQASDGRKDIAQSDPLKDELSHR